MSATLIEQVTIAPRFRGPPRSGNGGYVAGLLAAGIDAPAEVTLRLPTPLGRPLDIARLADGALALRDGAEVVAEAKPSGLDLEVPAAPPIEVCAAASARGGSFADSDYAGCFSCGRLHPDGLRVFAGAVPGRDMVAAIWQPAADFAGPDGYLTPQCLWAALDCSGAIALHQVAPKAMLTGRMTGAVDRDIEPGLSYRIIGWPIGGGGRKWFSGTAIIDPDGRVRGRVKATWIVLRDAVL